MESAGKKIRFYLWFGFVIVMIRLLINQNYWICIILAGLVIFFKCNNIYAKKLNRFKYIYKINNPLLQMKELELYKEQGGKLDYLYYNTLSNIQMYSLDFEGAAISNEIMFKKLKHPRIGERLIYKNNKCILLDYMKKYEELAELIVDYERSINKGKHNFKIKNYICTLVVSKLRLALLEKDIVSAKELLEEYKNIVSVDKGQAHVVEFYQAEIYYNEGNLEKAKELIDNIISNCDYRPLIYQAEELKKLWMG